MTKAVFPDWSRGSRTPLGGSLPNQCFIICFKKRYNILSSEISLDNLREMRIRFFVHEDSRCIPLL